MGLVVFVTLIGSLAYLVYSLRRTFQSLRTTLHDLVGEETLATRLLPNLSFTLLFFLLLFQSMQTKMPAPVSNLLGLSAVRDIQDVRNSGGFGSLTVAKETK